MYTITMSYAYHIASKKDLDNILRKGIDPTDSGAKTDKLIARTDEYLDAHKATSFNISRQASVYAYVVRDGFVYDITDGKKIAESAFICEHAGELLRLEIATERCYVSDTDAFDAVKDALQTGNDTATIEQLAGHYWDRIVPLDTFDFHSVRRPELMIPHAIKPRAVTKVT